MLVKGEFLLTDDEKVIVSSFATELLRSRALGARVFLRSILANYLGKPPAKVEIEIGKFGKPLVIGGPEFNLSHSGQIAAVALHPSLQVGIDIERCNNEIKGSDFASILSENEKRRAIQNPPRNTQWLQMWVRKEAVVKATGLGLHIDLTTIDVGFHNDKNSTWRKVPVGRDVNCNGGFDHIFLSNLALPHGCLGALAIASVSIPPESAEIKTDGFSALHES